MAYVKKELKVKGLIFTACYGAVGYLWETWIYVMVYGWIGAMIMQNPWFDMAIGQVVKGILFATAYSFLVAASLLWALYLSNMREINIKRGTTIGLGFGLAYSIWNYVLVYGAPLIIGFQMKFGIFSGDTETAQRVTGLAVENMYLLTLDHVIFIVILVGTTLIMAHFFQNGEKLKCFLVPFVSQFVIYFFNILFPLLMPDVLSAVIYHMFTSAIAIYALWVLLGFLKTGTVKLKMNEKKVP